MWSLWLNLRVFSMEKSYSILEVFIFIHLTIQSISKNHVLMMITSTGDRVHF